MRSLEQMVISERVREIDRQRQRMIEKEEKIDGKTLNNVSCQKNPVFIKIQIFHKDLKFIQ